MYFTLDQMLTVWSKTLCVLQTTWLLCQYLHHFLSFEEIEIILSTLNLQMVLSPFTILHLNKGNVHVYM